MKPRVFVTRAIPDAGLRILRQTCEVDVAPQDAPISREALERGMKGAVALVTMLTDKVDASLLDGASGLKIVANYAVGTNNIDVAACHARGVSVSNTPDVLTDATADLAMGLLIDVARGISSGDRLMRREGFKGWGPLYRLGCEVSGKTLGLIGFGRIGQAMAQRARAFRMRILYTQRRQLPENEALGASFVDLETLLRDSDFVSLHCPLNDSTRHLIGGRELALLKPGSFLINTARGPVIDEAALVQALKEGKLAGAGLDVFEREPELAAGLAELEQVVIPPHLGSATRECRDAMAVMVVDNILAVLAGREAPNKVLK